MDDCMGYAITTSTLTLTTSVSSNNTGGNKHTKKPCASDGTRWCCLVLCCFASIRFTSSPKSREPNRPHHQDINTTQRKLQKIEKHLVIEKSKKHK